MKKHERFMLLELQMAQKKLKAKQNPQP
jgi:hypothetical protein